MIGLMNIVIGTVSLTQAAVPRISPADAPSQGGVVATNAGTTADKPLQIEDTQGHALGVLVGQMLDAGNGTYFWGDTHNPGVVARRVGGAVVGLPIVRNGFIATRPSVVGVSVPWLTPFFLHESAACGDARFLLALDAPVRVAQVLGRNLTVSTETPGAAQTGYYAADPVQARTISGVEIAYDPAQYDCASNLGGTPTVPGFCCIPPGSGPETLDVGAAVSFDLSAFVPPFALK
jgi:hypothetical protein